MKLTRFLILFSLFSVTSFTQLRSITVEEYDDAFQFALTETNTRFPFVHTFTSETFEDGKLVSSSIHVAERQTQGLERQTFTSIENGKTTKTYQLRTAYGNSVYCSLDGKAWTGPQTYECPRSIRLYRPQSPTSTKYTVEDKIVAGSKVKGYRKFEVFESSGGEKPTFAEEVALIGSDRLFISTIETMGDLRSKQLTTKLTNAWKLNAQFTAIRVPKNATPLSKTPVMTPTRTIRKN